MAAAKGGAYYFLGQMSVWGSGTKVGSEFVRVFIPGLRGVLRMHAQVFVEVI